MIETKRLFEKETELSAIFRQPVIKRYGVVEFEEKPHKGFYRHEVLKICMRRNYPTVAMRSDLIDALNNSFRFSVRPYLKHEKVNKKRNIKAAHQYLKFLGDRSGYKVYEDRIKKNNEYRDVIYRFKYSLKSYIKELNMVFQKADHIHFLHEIVFVKNLQKYPFPRRWITLIAFYHKMPEYERLLAAIRVVTEYDGDSAPEFYADFF